MIDPKWIKESRRDGAKIRAALDKIRTETAHWRTATAAAIVRLPITKAVPVWIRFRMRGVFILSAVVIVAIWYAGYSWRRDLAFATEGVIWHMVVGVWFVLGAAVCAFSLCLIAWLIHDLWTSAASIDRERGWIKG